MRLRSYLNFLVSMSSSMVGNYRQNATMGALGLHGGGYVQGCWLVITESNSTISWTKMIERPGFPNVACILGPTFISQSLPDQ